MAELNELGVRMASVADLVRLMVSREEHERFLDYAIAFEFDGEESQLPVDVRQMLIEAEEKAKNPTSLISPKAYAR